MRYKVTTTMLIILICLGLLMAGCEPTPLPMPTPTPLDDFEAAVRTEIETQIGEFLDGGLRDYEVLTSRLQGDGNYGRLEARIVLEACPHFYYDLYYNAELKDGQWVLYNDEDTLSNLFKRWATAHSAALAGQPVEVPGSKGQRHVHLIPDTMPDLLQARLDGLSNPTVDPLVGFFICEEENMLWDEIDLEIGGKLRELIPQVEQSMDEALAKHFGRE